ncbi:MAG TPA: dihydropteroate synthase [Mycobacteriales bacterium]|nr:dihydropteroate synthase [Mycobacteriales bacterium]
MWGLPEPGRCVVVGVLNVTPDSFSDGGRYVDADAAVSRGRQMLAEGADIIDVGGESTRPGAERVPADDEIHRIEPVVRGLVAAGAVVSIDTMRRETAEVALSAGARLVNDVSGGLADSDLPRLVADRRVPYIVMHWRAHSAQMIDYARYDDVVTDVARELSERLETVVAAGVDPGQVILDPGLGFAKLPEHNWALLAHLDALLALGQPVLVGASRKSFLGSLLASPDGAPRDFAQRDAATTAITAIAATAGVWGVRVHEVRGSADAVKVAAALGAAGGSP